MYEPEPLQQVDRTYVRYGNRRLSYFSGCDYFRLASHPAVIHAAHDGLKKFGLNVSASRLTTGNHVIYQSLEKALMDFFAADDALLVPSGYMAATVAAQALAGNFSHALMDGRAHPALLDAARMLECPIVKFKHRDPDDFAAAVARCGRSARLIALTDGMFAQDGSIAPLKVYLKNLPRGGLILIDDAHGAGVLGKTGKGTVEIEGVSRQRVIQCITLSKAFGVYGGAILATPALRKRILERSWTFLGSTPLPLPLENAALVAIRTLQRNQQPRKRLLENTVRIKSALHDTAFRCPETPSPIIPIHLQSEHEMARLKRNLLAARIYPPFLKYPGSPANGYFRFVISSEHSRAQLDRLLAVLAAGSKTRIARIYTD
jgi:8-amino-7-oxononanoate synthase